MKINRKHLDEAKPFFRIALRVLFMLTLSALARRDRG
jgi:hypothetical protein